jgi:hypothetical protein
MAALLTKHYPVLALMNSVDTTPLQLEIPEAATQTFPLGVPVQLTGGYVAIWGGAYANLIAGFSRTLGQNLATNGAGAPSPFGQFGPPLAIQTWGNIPTQANAVNIALGTPVATGRTLFDVAIASTIFEIQCDASSGVVYNPTQANVGGSFGLTLDAGNASVYLDLAKTTVGTNTAVMIVGLSPVDGIINNARVRCKVLQANQALFT